MWTRQPPRAPRRDVRPLQQGLARRARPACWMRSTSTPTSRPFRLTALPAMNHGIHVAAVHPEDDGADRVVMAPMLGALAATRSGRPVCPASGCRSCWPWPLALRASMVRARARHGRSTASSVRVQDRLVIGERNRCCSFLKPRAGAPKHACICVNMSVGWFVSTSTLRLGRDPTIERLRMGGIPCPSASRPDGEREGSAGAGDQIQLGVAGGARVDVRRIAADRISLGELRRSPSLPPRPRPRGC